MLEILLERGGIAFLPRRDNRVPAKLLAHAPAAGLGEARGECGSVAMRSSAAAIAAASSGGTSRPVCRPAMMSVIPPIALPITGTR